MNEARREEISKAISKIEELKTGIEAAKEILEQVRDEEQEAFDNMPEGLQQGERGQAAENAVSELETVIDALDSFDVDDLVGNCQSAQGE